MNTFRCNRNVAGSLDDLDGVDGRGRWNRCERDAAIKESEIRNAVEWPWREARFSETRQFRAVCPLRQPSVGGNNDQRRLSRSCLTHFGLCSEIRRFDVVRRGACEQPSSASVELVL